MPLADDDLAIRVVKRAADAHPLRGIHSIPRIVRGAEDYDPAVESFLLAMPRQGVRSAHSMRAYATDISIWLRFLAARGKHVWGADGTDVSDFHAARRTEDAAFAISIKSWNRSVAALDKLYAWAEERRLVRESPLPKRLGWVRPGSNLPAVLVNRNLAYERGGSAPGETVKFISLDEYNSFRSVGLQGRRPDGSARPNDRGRNGWRNRLFADLVVTTGLRLEECSALLSSELEWLDVQQRKQIRLRLPRRLTKGDAGRTVWVSRSLIEEIRSYIELERANAVAKFLSREGWRKIPKPIWACEVNDTAARILLEDATWQWIYLDRLSPSDRLSLILCTEGQRPIAPAALWLSETGIPVKPNTWEVTFQRASARCRKAGMALDVAPHMLRHTFAVYMLMLLIRKMQELASDSASGAGSEIYRRIMFDPLRELQKRMGHRRIETTYIYLEHLRSIEEPADELLENFVNLISEEAVLHA